MESDSTLITTGMLPFLVLASAGLTAPVSLFLLWRYRRAVLDAMAGRSGGAAPARAHSAVAVPPPARLAVEITPALRLADREAPAYRTLKRSLAATIGVYVAAGLAYAVVLTGAWMVFTRDDGFPLTRLLMLAACYAWPIVITVWIVATVGPVQRVLAGAVYFGILAAIAGWSLARNPDLTPGQVVLFWLITNGPATVLLFAFLHRRIRAVGPLVLAFMVVAVTGSQVLLSIIGSSDSAMRIAVEVGGAFGLGGHETFFASIIAGFALFGVLGWWLLKRLGDRYQRRMMSDESLTVDSMWLLFGIEQSISLAFEGWGWVFTGLVAFAAYKAAKHAGFAILRSRGPSGSAPTLLLLRVFALGRRSERLFHALAKRWLRIGAIDLIAGPDLVGTTVEPHEFLQFMGGELSRRFVTGGADLEQRLRAAASGPDPDGRHRVNEYFCHADTWQATMRRLALRADAIVMDLRSFSPGNQGCLFEIEQLLDAVELRSVVVLVDATTDRAFLDGALQQAWAGISPGSPNRRAAAPLLRLLDVEGAGSRDVRVLCNMLLGDWDGSRDNARGAQLPMQEKSAG